VRHKVYSSINVVGLAVGLASFVLIFLYVTDELSYDRYHEKADRIYRVASLLEGAENSASMAFPVGPTLLAEYPDYVEAATRLFNFQAPAMTISYTTPRGDIVRYNESRFFFADSTTFEVFDFELLRGDEATALATPNTILITESTARKYFKEEDPVGKTIRLERNGNLDFEIVGILADTPRNSHFEFDFLASMVTLDAFGNGGPYLASNWYYNPAWTYIVLKEGANRASFEASFPDFVARHWPTQIIDESVMYLQRLTDIHLTSRLDFEIRANSDEAYVYIFSIIAVFILAIACINFMNLTTARSIQRAREVGLRKVLGALRPQLVRQFLGESTLLSVLATLIALPIIYATLPVLNNFAGKAMTFNPVKDAGLFAGLFLLSLLVGALSGLYPALFLSSFQPAKVLKGTVRIGSANAATLLRKGLVVMQFVISILLIVGTLVVYDQLDYMQSKSLGFDKDEVVLINILGSPVSPRYDSFKSQLLENPRVMNVTAVHDIPGSKYQTLAYTLEGQDEPYNVPNMWVYDDAVTTLKMELLAGRDYSEAYPADSAQSIIINESLSRLMGFGTPEETLGHKINIFNTVTEVIGVVKDFHYASLHADIGPFVIDYFRGPGIFRGQGRYVAVRIAPDDVPGTLAFLRDKWAQFVPDREMEFRFLDQELDDLYKGEATLGRVATGFSILAILVACLGLFGMAMFSAETRTKEIGIRKVLGSSTTGILFLLSKESASLIAVAFVLACPIAYFSLQRWLTSFTFHTEVTVLPFIVAGFLVLLVAWLTVSVQSIKAATANPVESLQYE
jgi:putative ABC transport system permease protein